MWLRLSATPKFANANFSYPRNVMRNYHVKLREDGNMRIIAINGSPRKDGRISKIVDEMIKGAEENGTNVR